jgi:hypothetical protein
MYSYTIKEQIKALVDSGVIPRTKQDKAVGVLNKYWNNKIAVVWDSSDVIEFSKDSNIELTEENAISILYSILDNHDAEYGITWSLIQSHIDDIKDNEIKKVRKSEMKDLPLLLKNLQSEEARQLLEDILRDKK